MKTAITFTLLAETCRCNDTTKCNGCEAQKVMEAYQSMAAQGGN